MKRIVNVICAFDLIFLLLLVLSSFIVNDIVSETVYYLAFIIPILIGAYYLKREKPFTENADTVYLSFDKGSFGYFMPIAFPAIAMIISISYITSFVMGAFGIESNAEISVSLPEALLVYALVPAVLEEALFRFIPLKLLLPYSKKWAIILSALFFSVIHIDLFQLPYAFAAGVIFALIDVKCQSVFPSMIIHAINNTAAVIIMTSGSDTVAIAIYATVGALALISAVFIAIRRNVYRDIAKPLFEKEEKVEIGTAPVILTALCVFIAASVFMI